MFYPEEIQNLVDEFGQFPGIGPKTAQRFVFYLLKQNSLKIERLISFLEKIKGIKACSVCNNFSAEKVCSICRDSRRDHRVITVVAQPQDLVAIEKTKEYKGVYYILGGLLNTVQDKKPNDLKISSLIDLIKKNKVNEIIFALSSTIEGESTMLYIVNLIKKDPSLSYVKLSRIARGLPLGGEIEYADEITLTEALKGRKIL